MVFNNNLLLGAAGQGGAGYEIDQSIRFNDDDAAYLYRDNVSAQTDTKKFTYSVWLKRGAITGGTNTGLLSGGSGTTSGRSDFIFTAGGATGDSTNDALKFDIYTGGWTQRRTTALLRDPSAWYHIVLVYDAANATANDTLIIYQNGTRLTLDSTSGVPNNLSLVNANSQRTKVGADASGTPVEFDGYMAEINMIDGQALAPTSFGETNDDGVWIPKAYDGSYGNNGFYITGATAGDLGEDFSGNNNDFTSTGLATTDQMLDTPTDNYCVLSPIDKNSNVTLKDGNLVASAGGGWYHGRGTLFAPSGKWYYEWIPTAGSYAEAGWMLNVSGNDYTEEESDVATTFYRGVGAAGHGFRIGSSATDSAVTNFALNDVIMMAIDVDTMKMWVGINGTWYNSGDPAGGTNPVGTWTDAIGQSVAPWYGLFTSTSETFNFGQRPFAYTIPTGFNSWNTANLATPSITDGSKYFNPVLFTGNSGTAFSVTGVGFQPDFVWGKPRSYADNHRLMDVVRGSTKQLITNATNAEFTQAQGITSFDSDGFTVGTHNGLNTGTNTYVGWCWLADNTTGSSNTDGSINTTATSVNTTAGFSISTYTGTGSNATVGHGLGIAPKMVIVKRRDSTSSWRVYHAGLTSAAYVLNMESTGGQGVNATVWNSTDPTSSVFSIGTNAEVNTSGGTYLAYCFAEIPGYSSFGKYVGNGSANGPFIYTNGMTPKYVMIKRTNSTGYWDILDTTREPFNSVGNQLFANRNSAEASNDHEMDFVSNGIKIRDTSTSINASGSTYIYMAFAEHPFGGDGAAPATAR